MQKVIGSEFIGHSPTERENRFMAARKKAARSRAKKAAKKTPARKYSRAAQKRVSEELHELKRGRLRMGRSGKKVRSRKQAIDIGLSEARRSGKKVPPPKQNRSKK